MPRNISQPGGSVDSNERRQHPRHQVNALAYLDIGPDNGGIILNISEGGLALHAVGSLPPDPVIDLRIQFSKSTKRLETTGKVAWTSGSKKDAGIEFVDLPEEDYLQIKEWLSQNSSEPFPTERKPKPELAPPPPKKRTDKWIKLAAELPDFPAGIIQDAAGTSKEPAEQQLAGKFTGDEALPSEPAEPGAANVPDLTAKISAPDASLITENGAHAVPQETPPPSAAIEIPPSAPLSRFFDSGGSPENAKDSQSGAHDSVASNRPAEDLLTRARAILNDKRRAGEEASQRLLAESVAAARSFWSRNSAGALAAFAIAAIVCLSLGIVIGRSIFKPSPKMTATVVSVPPDASQPPPTAAPQKSTASDTNDGSDQRVHSQSSAAKPASHRHSSGKKTTATNVAGVGETTQDSPDRPENNNAMAAPAGSSANTPTLIAASPAPIQAPITTPTPPTAQASTPEPRDSVSTTNGTEAPRTLAPPDRLLPSYLIYRVAPTYPQEAIDQKIEGTVKIHLIIGRNGRVKNLRVVTGPAALHQAALDAAVHWRYIPALRNGEPVETEEDISVIFHLPE